MPDSRHDQAARDAAWTEFNRDEDRGMYARLDTALDAFLAALPHTGKPTVKPQWLPIEAAPRDRFIHLWCSEDRSIWTAKWQGGRWYGVDDMGLTREGHSVDDERVVTGWAVELWQPLPEPPALQTGGET